MNHFHAPNFPGFQPYLNAVGMKRRFGQDVLYYAFGQRAATLILFQDDGNFQSGMNILTLGTC